MLVLASSSLRDQMDVSSLAKVTDGRDQVAGADGDLVAEGLVDEVGILEAAAELLASAEALTGSTVS
ncbi:hypothetical protein [Actinomyces naeslundii]|uniref:hypothetical protein n=1 Tax=Actinomyces naeslundii TaxID=1655 RepID=UPI001F39F126|nr:hypothetical protein [Actinomyces naeslundii]